MLELEPLSLNSLLILYVQSENMFGKKYHNNLRNTQIFEMKSREVQLTLNCDGQVT
jgi:hypothetical protein